MKYLMVPVGRKMWRSNVVYASEMETYVAERHGSGPSGSGLKRKKRHTIIIAFSILKFQ